MRPSEVRDEPIEYSSEQKAFAEGLLTGIKVRENQIIKILEEPIYHYHVGGELKCFACESIKVIKGSSLDSD